MYEASGAPMMTTQDGRDMSQSPDSFAAAVLPHLDAAHNLARWLMRNAADAEDVLQEAMLRALTYYPGFRGANPRGWLLQIVRNAAYASLRLNRGTRQIAADETVPELADSADDPELALMRQQEKGRVEALLAALPVELREVLILRELEELSYKEIAQIVAAPIGTVMSRLWRARQLLAAAAKQGDRR
jgi:RNA polymerase sigma-70 factor (ECF subfamily)